MAVTAEVYNGCLYDGCHGGRKTVPSRHQCSRHRSYLQSCAQGHATR
jgi:hypothetical protein